MRSILIKQIVLSLSFLSLAIIPVFSQDFMMQGWYWDYPKPFNPNGNPVLESTWAKTLTDQASSIGQAGFTYLWLPPLSRASFGSYSNGYDPKDLYDLGEFGQGSTGFGFRQDVDALITALTSAGIEAIADVVYNHRDGGNAENNPAVKEYITNQYGNPNTENPYPSDRYRIRLPLGGSSGNGAGDYYIKISSKTGDSRFHNNEYRIYTETNIVSWQGLPNSSETEPNGGGDCGETFNTITLGRNFDANIDAIGCTVDEFKITLSATDFDPAGDYLYIYLPNYTGNYSDHRPYGIWNASAAQDVVGQLEYQTYTDFTGLPSGRGAMDYSNFRPGSTTDAITETLAGDWNSMLFFYDYDQSKQDNIDTLYEWSKWLWDDVGIRGYRMDAVKHFDYTFVGNLLDDLHDDGKDPGMIVGEFFDGNPALLEGWITNVESQMDADTKANIDIRVFDFALRFALRDACDAFGYDARNVFNSGMVNAVGSDPFNVVTFVNNHDYRTAAESIANDPMLAYAYILTNNQIGLPSVFYPDYFGTDLTPDYPLVYLKPEIDQLIDLHTNYIYQSNAVDYLSRFGTPYGSFYDSGFDNTTLVYQLSGGVGGREVIVAINFAGVDLQVYHQINTSAVDPGETFTELTGNGLTGTTDLNGNNELYFQLPARSYGVWVEGDLTLPVDLLSFELEQLNTAVNLSWSSLTESNLASYQIERSTNGVNFNKLADLPARGSNSNYVYLDQNPGNSTVYYRLKLIDEDGTFKYSELKTASFSAEHATIKIYPNPSNGLLYVDSDSNFSWKIVNMQGQVLQQGSKQNNQEEIDLTSLSKGLYFIKTNNGFVKRFILN